MGKKVVIGPFDKGLRTDVTPFNIDNVNFPVLLNAYQWRGRVKRKRGTSLLNRLQRLLGTTDGAGNFSITISPQPILTGIVWFQIGTDYFVDPGTTANPVDQILLTNSSGLVHTLNRVTGLLTITGSNANTSVIYYPCLPVMGLEDYTDATNAFPQSIGFDTRYSYRINTSFPYTPVDITFYKATNTPFWWNGANYQQFWTTNYLGAFWATNGIDIPFTGSTIGMQFSHVTAVSGTINSQTVTITVTGANLTVGDYVFLNEFDPAIITGINGETGIVTAGAAPGAVTITIANANMNGPGGATVKGIVQYLTNSSNFNIDCIRFYDGTGWVNFMPPLSQNAYIIDDNIEAIYYLVGARMILPFKDRLVFFGPVIQTSTGNPIYLNDTAIFSQNGTPYYTAQFSGDIFNPTNPPGFVPILVPSGQTAQPSAYWEDQIGFGGWQSAGVDQNLCTISPNEDALIAGFETSIQARFIYTGNDVNPFQFYLVNAELGSSSTFSIVNMDDGVITRGPRGFIKTAQTVCSRIDLDIPDDSFEISNQNNGTERVCAQRDFINEWIYFTYPSNQTTDSNVTAYIFPNQTLFYNYRDDSWAMFNESYTTYGTFRASTGYTWATIGNKYATWAEWNESWSSGASTPLQPKVICGNQQGFIFFRDQGTEEATSLTIQNIVGIIVTSPNHCLNLNDYIIISVTNGLTGINGNIYSVVPQTVDTFLIIGPPFTGTYAGGGLITRMYVPVIASKQFPLAWDMGRKTRLGPQQYLLTRTDTGQYNMAYHFD